MDKWCYGGTTSGTTVIASSEVLCSCIKYIWRIMFTLLFQRVYWVLTWESKFCFPLWASTSLNPFLCSPDFLGHSSNMMLQIHSLIRHMKLQIIESQCILILDYRHSCCLSCKNMLHMKCDILFDGCKRWKEHAVTMSYSSVNFSAFRSSVWCLVEIASVLFFLCSIHYELFWSSVQSAILLLPKSEYCSFQMTPSLSLEWLQ